MTTESNSSNKNMIPAIFQGEIEYSVTGMSPGRYVFHLMYDPSIKETLNERFGIASDSIEPKHLVAVPGGILKRFPYLVSLLIEYIVAYIDRTVTQPFAIQINGRYTGEYFKLSCIYIGDDQ